MSVSYRYSTSRLKTIYTTTNTYEQRFRYHRAVRKGPFIFVSGTTSLNPETNEIDYPGNAKAQADLAMRRCVEAVEALGGRIEDVCRVRVYVARQEDTEDVGKVMRRWFGEVGVAATMVVLGGEGGGFVDMEMLVEVEVDAVVG